LALTKTLAFGQSPDVAIGDLVTFTVTVYNQGTISAQNVEVVDYLPLGLSLADTDWTASTNNTAITTVAGPIAAGASASVDITVLVTADASDPMVNIAEIFSAEDENGVVQSDIDSTPDMNSDNDGPVTDNETGNANGDEDDHDIATVGLVGEPDVFDLALNKALADGQSETVAPGDQVTYTITVMNQGTMTAVEIEVVDYLPADVTLADANWAMGGTGNAYTTISGPLEPGESVTVNVTVTLDDDVSGGSMVNYAEISQALDVNGSVMGDYDSTPDDIELNDAGGQPGSDADGSVTGDGSGTPGDGISFSDEDDHDPASILINPDDCDNPTDCGVVDLCTEPITAITICPDFCAAGDYTLIDFDSAFDCALVPSADGDCFTYTPLPGMEAFGSDVVTVTGQDASGSCFTVTYNIQVGSCSENNPPVITNAPEGLCAQPMVAMTICLDATDPDNDNVSICDIETLSNCNINFITDLCFVYIALPLQEGTDIVNVTVCDDGNPILSDMISFPVSVGCGEPTANADVLIVDTESASLNGQGVTYSNGAAVFDPSVNDDSNDVCNENLFVSSIVSGPANGTAMVVNGNIQYEGDEGFVGTDEIEYEVCNDCGNCDVAVISIEADLEVCQTVIETCTEPITPLVVCVDFCNIDDGIVIAAETLFECSITVDGTDCFTYVPLPGLTGTDSVTVVGMNTAGETDMATVYVDVEGCGGQLLIANDDEIFVLEGESVTVNVLSNDVSDGVLTEPSVDQDASFGTLTIQVRMISYTKYVTTSVTVQQQQ